MGTKVVVYVQSDPQFSTSKTIRLENSLDLYCQVFEPVFLSHSAKYYEKAIVDSLSKPNSELIGDLLQM